MTTPNGDSVRQRTVMSIASLRDTVTGLSLDGSGREPLN